MDVPLARGLTTKHAIKQVGWLLSDDGIDVDAALCQYGSTGPLIATRLLRVRAPAPFGRDGGRTGVRDPAGFADALTVRKMPV